MLILPEYNRPLIIDNLLAPLVAKYNWMFDAPNTDFVLNPIQYLEETSGSCVRIRINNSEFWVPSSWSILIVDPDTYQIDTVGISSCASADYSAFAFAPDENSLRTFDIMVLDFTENMSVVHPMISKGQGLVHPVGPMKWTSHGKELDFSVVIGPHDLHKFLANKVVGDIFFWD